MSQSSKDDRDEPPTPPKQSTAVLLIRDIADTTWRMFVPTIGLTLLGVWIDHRYDVLPYATIAGIMLGVAVTTLLIRKQFKRL